MKKMIYVLVISFLSFTLFSCAKKSDTSSTTTTTTELEGAWQTSCYLDSADNHSYITTISVTGTNLEIKDESHDDSSCNTDNGTLVASFSSLSIGEEELSFSSGATGHKFTMNLASFKYTPETAADVSYVNTNSICGYSDWALNTEKDITGKTCGSLTIPVANTTYLSIYKLVGNNLYLGSFGTTGSYPNSVSNAKAYIKQ